MAMLTTHGVGSSAAAEPSSNVVVIVGRSGLTPPPSPSPVTCSDQVQIPNSRTVTEQSPNKRYGVSRFFHVQSCFLMYSKLVIPQNSHLMY